MYVLGPFTPHTCTHSSATMTPMAVFLLIVLACNGILLQAAPLQDDERQQLEEEGGSRAKRDLEEEEYVQVREKTLQFFAKKNQLRGAQSVQMLSNRVTLYKL